MIPWYYIPVTSVITYVLGFIFGYKTTKRAYDEALNKHLTRK